MRFRLIDRVLERAEDRLLAIKQVSIAEEYLQDHFPTFPVLPGVLMLEAMVQAGRALCERSPADPPLVLGKVRALKYGQFVKPGAAIVVDVRRLGETDGAFDLKAEVRLLEPGSDPNTPGLIAASGRLTLRPVRIAAGSAERTAADRVGSD